MLCLFKRGFKGIEVAASAAFSTSPSPSAVQSILSLRPRAQYSHHGHILRIAFAMEPEDRPFGLFVLPRFGAKARRQHESAKAGCLRQRSGYVCCLGRTNRLRQAMSDV